MFATKKAVTPLLVFFANSYLCYAGFEGDNTFKGGKGGYAAVGCFHQQLLCYAGFEGDNTFKGGKCLPPKGGYAGSSPTAIYVMLGLR